MGVRGGGSAEPWPLRHSLVVFLVGATAALVAFLAVYTATHHESVKNRVDVSIKAAAAVAAVAAGLLTWARLELSRHEHRLGVDRDLTDRYGRGVNQLAINTSALARVGGIFALERFALDAVSVDRTNDIDWRMALELLATLARQDSARLEQDQGLIAPPITVIEAIRVIGRFPTRSGLGTETFTEYRANLDHIVAPGANLYGVALTRADLHSANLHDADLQGADLTGAYLMGADLRGANFTRADLQGADLHSADLTGAYLMGADLRTATLVDVDLHGADLQGANLDAAVLTRADLRRATLVNADPDGAVLIDIKYNESTTWPAGFDPIALDLSPSPGDGSG